MNANPMMTAGTALPSDPYLQLANALNSLLADLNERLDALEERVKELEAA